MRKFDTLDVNHKQRNGNGRARIIQVYCLSLTIGLKIGLKLVQILAKNRSDGDPLTPRLERVARSPSVPEERSPAPLHSLQTLYLVSL